jgi:phosphate transport system substrate-binding protein
MRVNLQNGLLIFLILAGAIVFFSCGSNTSEKKVPDTPTSGYITVKGSEEILPMITEEAYAFMDLYEKSKVLVLDGGSDLGLAAIFTDSAQIAVSTRAMSDAERKRAGEAGFKINEYKIAKDGIAIVVNPKNPIKKLTLEQVTNIFSGKIKNWSEVKGADLPIEVCVWTENSGTYKYFKDSILRDKDYTKNAWRFATTEDIIKHINGNPSAVGMISSARLYYNWSPIQEETRIKALSISQGPQGDYIYPDEATVHSAKYPLTRYIYLYTPNDPKGLDSGFISYITASAGQKLIAGNGFVPITIPVKYTEESTP